MKSFLSFPQKGKTGGFDLRCAPPGARQRTAVLARTTGSAFNILRGLAMLAALFLAAAVQAAQVRAWLDRNSMQLGETATLNVEVTGSVGAAKPDFSVLQQDFNVLGTESSSSMNIFNGQTISKLLWAVGLEPKRAGTLTIPALAVAGGQTEPITLTVAPASAASGKAGDDLFLDLSVEPKSPYVQQQVRVAVKLYYALNLTDGNLEDPHGAGLNARKLGQDASYTADVGGRRYRVLERHYALTAEKSGTVTLEPIVFRGHVVDPGDINSFFSRGRTVTARVPGETLEVRPRPPGSGTDAWLPAQALTLTAEGIDANTQAHVGEPLTLTLRLKAQGLAFEQLPELKLPKIDGADVYPDKETTANRDDGDWLHGERARKFAIVPNRAGPLTIPPLSLDWWDAAHDRAASAELSGLTLNIAAGAAAAAAPATADSTNIQIPTPASSLPAPAADRGAAQSWRVLAFAGFGLWLLTLAAWLAWALTRRRPRAAAGPAPASARRVDANAGAARKAFADACRSNDVSAMARALLAWARGEGGTARTLGELALSLGEETQRTALREIERSLYGTDAAAALVGERIAAAFRNGFAFVHAARTTPTPALPPLYPIELRKSA